MSTVWISLVSSWALYLTPPYIHPGPFYSPLTPSVSPCGRFIELECVQASAADISGDHCAICWDPMDTARRLDCKHCFHA